MDLRQCDCFPNDDVLLEKAKRLAATTTSAAIASNTITLYTMLVLQNMLSKQIADPVNNREHILAISNTISNLAEGIIVID